MPNSHHIAKFGSGAIGTLGTTIELNLKTGQGEDLKVIFDTEYLAKHLPLLMGVVSRAKQVADAGLPSRSEPGEQMVSRAAPVSAFHVHQTQPHQPVALEFELAPHDLPITFSLPRKLARLLCDRLLASLSQ